MKARQHVIAAFAVLPGLLTSGMTTAVAQAPVQLSPGPSVAKPPSKPAPDKAAPKATRKPPVQPTPSAAAPTATNLAQNVDLAYGAYQRGFYITAFAIATRRVEEKGDVRAMTLLGELYARGYGIARDDAKAADWYRLAADRGDREAMFALAMFHLVFQIPSPRWSDTMAESLLTRQRGKNCAGRASSRQLAVKIKHALAA